MKLAIVRQKYTPFGGAERFVDQAIGALRAQGVDVSIVARQWTGDVQGITLDPFYLGRTWRDVSFVRAVQRLIASRQFDLVQSHERIPGCHIYRAGDGVHATWLEIRNKPLDALSPWHRYILRAEEAMFRHPNLRAVICNSRMVRDDIARRFGVSNEKLHVIYNGVDIERFHPGLREEHRARLRAELGVGEATRVVLFVGSGFERKGLPTLIEAMRAVDAELWVVGRDKSQAAMEAKASRAGIPARFFGGQIDVRPYYGAADILALPTTYDPLPNAVLEAMACGLPVVTTSNCGAAELLRADRDAVVSAGDISLLSEAVERTLNLSCGEAGGPDTRLADLALHAMAERLRGLYAALSRD